MENKYDDNGPHESNTEDWNAEYQEILDKIEQIKDNPERPTSTINIEYSDL